MRRAARTVLLPAVLTVLALAVQFGPAVVPIRGPAWLADLGPSSVRFALWEGLWALGTVAALAGACALGYREARHREVGPAYLRYVGVVASAGTTVLLLVLAGWVVFNGSNGSNPFLGLLTVVTLLVGVPGILTVAALAGVAFASTCGDDTSVRSDAELGPLALGAATVAGTGYLLNSVADLAITAGDGVGVAASLPQFGSTGATVLAYLQAGQLAGDIVVIGAGMALGVLAVSRRGVATPSRRFVGIVAAGALGGLLVAWVSVTWYVTTGGGDASAPSFVSAAASFPDAVVWTGVVTVLAVVAGVGVAQFETDRPDAAGGEGTDSTSADPAARPR
ncbi:hypothetical protein [Halosimplex pelagicum]|uniref:Uncharacterized protein n=1 Tax=Halosimplex pelagicum TaxID=869886 RepID=A0A7D5P663_9EURY|nr:hypothetical protein [Halosimplex pelagicum]QLH80121.1 hypothetical protein HZS54_00100 [Halosimplex pelagicum]